MGSARRTAFNSRSCGRRVPALLRRSETGVRRLATRPWLVMRIHASPEARVCSNRRGQTPPHSDSLKISSPDHKHERLLKIRADDRYPFFVLMRELFRPLAWMSPARFARMGLAKTCIENESGQCDRPSPSRSCVSCPTLPICIRTRQIGIDAWLRARWCSHVLG